MAQRMSGSMLEAIGRGEWIARSEVEYVDKVVALAGDEQGRRRVRAQQRAQMGRSPMCDAAGLTGHLEQAYFEMFGRWIERSEGR